MRKKRIIYVIFISLILIAIVLVGLYIIRKSRVIDNWMFTDEQIMEYGPFWISVPALENTCIDTDVNLLIVDENNEKVMYFILPEDVSAKRIVCYIRDGYENNYEARRVINLESGEAYIAGVRIKLIKTDVPIIYLKTDNENTEFSEFKYSYNRDLICSGTIHNKEMGQSCDMYLKARGNATWAGPNKKPYSLVLSNEQNLAGIGRYDKFNLIADCFDPSLLKNYTINSIAHAIGVEYEPKAIHTVLYIDGSFEGVYLLTTKVSVGKKLVNIGEDDVFFVWGGNHAKQVIPYQSKSWFFDSDYHFPYVALEYPKKPGRARTIEIQNLIQRYVDAVEDYNSNEYEEYLDMNSMMRYYWIQELCMNVDAAFRSTYSIYSAETDKITYAPLWDFDFSLGSTAKKPAYDGSVIEFENPEGWKVRNLAYYHDLFMHEGFEEAANEAYYNLGIRNAFYKGIDTYLMERDRILELGELDYKIWKNEEKQFALFTDAPTYYDYTEKTLELYRKRLEWVDGQVASNTNGK